MNCPYCGNPMEKGKIPTNNRELEAYWLPDEEKIPKWIVSHKTFEKRNGVILTETPFLAVTYIEAHICRACKKGVFEIPEE